MISILFSEFKILFSSVSKQDNWTTPTAAIHVPAALILNRLVLESEIKQGAPELLMPKPSP